MIGHGGYAFIFHPPRNHIPKKYRDQKYIQRYTHQARQDINLGEMTRSIFDPSKSLTRPILAIYKQPDHWWSQILEYYDGSFDKLLEKYPDKDPELFWIVLSWMSRFFQGFILLHKEGYVHHDVRTLNILYNDKPNLKLCFIDWATSVPFSQVWDSRYKSWHEGNNENFPPEYKAFAHFKYGMSVRDFAREFSPNKAYHLILKIDPKYPYKLRKAFRYIQKRLNASNDSYTLMTNNADKIDVFALGIVLLEAYVKWMSKDPLQKQLVLLISSMLDPNPFTRWDIKKVSKFTQSLLEAHEKHTSLRMPSSSDMSTQPPTDTSKSKSKSTSKSL